MKRKVAKFSIVEVRKLWILSLAKFCLVVYYVVSEFFDTDIMHWALLFDILGVCFAPRRTISKFHLSSAPCI